MAAPSKVSLLPAYKAGKLALPPHTPLAGEEKGSFAEGTITARLPSIVSSLLRDMREEYAAVMSGADSQAAASVLAAIAEVEALSQDMAAGAPVRLLQCPPGASQLTQAIIEASNEGIELWAHARGKAFPSGSTCASGAPVATWLNLPWLAVECHMYATLHAALQRQSPTQAYDPFRRQKRAALVKSKASAEAMAKTTLDAVGKLQQSSKSVAAVKEALADAVNCALWGNRTDLSLLVHAEQLDTALLASSGGGSAASKAASGPDPHLIVDDWPALWRRFEALLPAGSSSSSSPRVVDLVLDNSGLELFADLCLADILMETGVADKVVLHGKSIPWFVSDTLEHDLQDLLDFCAHDTSALSAWPGTTPAEASALLTQLSQRWKAHLSAGRWSWSAHLFWTTPAPFCWMAQLSPDLHQHLSSSSLVVFKGDLNYRKLTLDCRWPSTTPFSEVLMGFTPAPLVALRTCKADVVAGLAPGQAEALDALDRDWCVNGKFGMVQAAGL